jgi:hypothetical protein
MGLNGVRSFEEKQNPEKEGAYLAIPRQIRITPWLAFNVAIALFLWCINIRSCIISGINASTTPAPNP